MQKKLPYFYLIVSIACGHKYIYIYIQLALQAKNNLAE